MKLNLKPNPDNPRTIGKEEFERLKKKIAENPDGLRVHRILHKDGIIIAGNQRWRALNELKLDLKDEWFVDATGWTDQQVQDWLIDSNVSEGVWDYDILGNQYDAEYLLSRGVELPYDPKAEKVEEDEAPEVSSEPPVSQLGEIYQLGRHKVVCGDSTDPETLKRLFGKDKASIGFTSPPYNVGHNLGYDKKSKYQNDDDNKEDYYEFLQAFNKLALDYCKYSFVNLQFLANNKKDLLTFIYSNSDLFCDVAFWKKLQVAPAMAENVMNSQVECIFIFGGNGSRAINTGNFRGNVSNIIETNSASTENENSKIHNATFPIEFVSYFIKHFTKEKDVVYDAFSGSGSGLIACEQLDRTFYGCELDPKYVDVIRKRYAKFIDPENWEATWEKMTPAID